MKRDCRKFLVVLATFVAALTAQASNCLAWYDWIPGCDCCRRCCEFRLVNGCTRCAWRRTWYGPNALATPLNPYFIPRPAQCCNCGGLFDGCGYAVNESYGTCDGERCDTASAANVYPPELGDAFGPAKLERLGQIRNEMDMVGAAGGPAHASAPAR